MDIKLSPWLVLVLCTGIFLRTSLAQSSYDETGDESEYYDEEPMDPDQMDESSGLARSTTDTSLQSPTTQYTITTAEYLMNDSIAKRPDCPYPCSCANNQTEFVNCSSRNLTQIPNIPFNVIHLDLSHNRIKVIPDNTFVKSNALKDLQISFNQISRIEPTTFSKAIVLENVDLTANAIQHLDADAFFGTSLSSLSLAHNPLELRSEGSLLNLPNLTHLSLQACNLTNVYYETFHNLTGLTSLDLRNNSFEERLYVKAFTNMTQLKRLKLNALPRSSALELCTLLKEIDEITINTTLGLSCFEFTAGSTFEESLVTPPPLLHKLYYSSEESKTKVQTTSPTPATTTTTSTTSSTITNTISTKSLIINALSENQTRADVMLDANSAITVDKMNTSSTPTIVVESSHKVHVSSSTLRHILIGIIVVAFVGLAIGLCCRRDIFGIKTKLCRTSVRGPTATDQVRPAEQVPLKEIEMRDMKKEVV